jgi:D-inositol-3-phosphate glycosyltransferase
MDAYAFRTPVIASDVGAIGPTVRADQTGWVVPPNDPHALGATILDALCAPADDIAARMARAAAARAPAAVGARLRAIYSMVVGEARPST